ncbi:MAG: TRAP transporter large permease [Planctomycetota bacterium]|jgi:C4-dicarboxylate transporter DctM subunit|nr:TRAP transporter large permease [Planctomycetota bacterium]
MTDVTAIGAVLFGVLALLLVFGVPIAMSLGVSAMTCMYLMDIPLAAAAQRIFTALDAYSIMAIPFFVLAGNFMTSGGISRRLVEFVNSIVGRVRGGMAYATVLACAFFAALSGSAPATVIAIGSTVYPEIVKLGYPRERSAGLLAVAGGLGPIIPPSIIMVVYGTITNCSISNLFSAGIVAGSMIIVALVIVSVIYSRKEKWPKEEGRITFLGLVKSTFMAIPALLLPVIILGGIYSGYLTPTESASVSVVYAFMVGVFLYRAIPMGEALSIVLKSAKSSAMILFIIATSTAFSWVFTMSGISRALVNAIIALEMSPLLFSLAIAVLLLIFGTFLEGIAICVLLVPVLWPIADNMGLNNVHFGMIVCIANVIGTMTPPVAVNLFAASSVTGLRMGAIAKGELPFFIGYTAVFFIVVIFPWFSTFFI